MNKQAQTQGLGEFAHHGFTLEHLDDHVLGLSHEGKGVATFSQVGATEDSLQHACALHLVIKHGWNGCLWEKGK